MGTHGAGLRSLLAHMDMAAVAALSDHVPVPREHQAALHIGQQLAVLVLMLLPVGGGLLKDLGDLHTAFLLASEAKQVHLLRVWDSPAKAVHRLCSDLLLFRSGIVNFL